ncbi:MAG: hypothetical protein JXN59_08700 [Anaerolineae bacterium]|nr:hypothetical protein [Anaerolineae bacterium]
MATGQKMTEQEMQALAEEVIAMPINKARGHVRRLDPDSELELWRVGVGHELLTRVRLPNRGVVVTLVEKEREETYTAEDQTQAFQPRIRFEPEFVEVRVVPLD